MVLASDDNVITKDMSEQWIEAKHLIEDGMALKTNEKIVKAMQSLESSLSQLVG